MNIIHSIAAFAVAAASMTAAFAAEPSAPAPATLAAKPVIVLVHGAFADASGWGRVITLLEKDGYTVIAPQNPLTSLADDIATTKRVIDAQKGPVIVVGHSYAGVVITGATSGNPNVKALVYIAAYAPDAGESIGSINDKFAANDLGKAIMPDAAGFLYIDRAKFHSIFCADVSETEASIMAATQKPIAGATFGQTLENPAWKTIPTWYMVAADDQTINPDAERFMAKRMNAHTSEVKASHVAFISHSKEVVGMIEEAAKSTMK